MENVAEESLFLCIEHPRSTRTSARRQELLADPMTLTTPSRSTLACSHPPHPHFGQMHCYHRQVSNSFPTLPPPKAGSSVRLTAGFEKANHLVRTFFADDRVLPPDEELRVSRLLGELSSQHGQLRLMDVSRALVRQWLVHGLASSSGSVFTLSIFPSGRCASAISSSSSPSSPGSSPMGGDPSAKPSKSP